MAAFVGLGVPNWDIRDAQEGSDMLVKTPYYLEMNARMQYQAIVLAGPRGEIRFMDDREVAANVSWQNYERSWQLWKARVLAKLATEGSAASR